jgi:hypothetical protein
MLLLRLRRSSTEKLEASSKFRGASPEGEVGTSETLQVKTRIADILFGIHPRPKFQTSKGDPMNTPQVSTSETTLAYPQSSIEKLQPAFKTGALQSPLAGASGVIKSIAERLYTVNPDSVSKVVDSNSEPLIVYHGTKSDFSV